MQASFLLSYSGPFKYFTVIYHHLFLYLYAMVNKPCQLRRLNGKQTNH